MQVRLDGDLARALGAPEHRRRRGDEVADAVDVEDEPVGACDRRACREGGRSRVASRASGGVSAWQIATASASASCVVGGLVVEGEDHPHHPLHLILVGAPVPADRLLHARRRVLGALDPGGGGGDQRGAARLPDGERDAGVGPDVRLLERDGVRRVLRDERCDPVEDRPEAELRALARGRVASTRA